MRGVARFGPLKERPFRFLWLGRTGSSVGDALIPVALAFAVLGIHGGATGLGIVLASRMVATGSVTLAGGVWADRVPRRAVMISADLLRFAVESTTAVLLLEGTAHVWQLAVLQSLAGVGAGFFGPASTALVPQTVSPGRLQQANSLLSMSDSSIRIFGPAASGLIVAVAGPGWCFAIDAASFLVSVAFVSVVKVADYLRPARQRFWREIADGWLEVRRHRWLTAGFLGYALGNVGIGIYLVLGPVVALAHLHGEWGWGVIVATGQAGGLLGGLIAYRIRPSRPVATAFAIWAVGGILPFSLAQPFPLVAVMLASGILGAAILIGNALWETAMQQEVERSKLARVAAIDQVLSICLMPTGQALAGAIWAGLGIRTALILAGLLMSVPNLAVLAFVREMRAVRRRDEADPEADPAPALAG